MSFLCEHCAGQFERKNKSGRVHRFCSLRCYNAGRAKPVKAKKESFKANLILAAEARASGNDRYFTGRLCKKGHISERRSTDGACLDCYQINLAKSRPKQRAAYALACENGTLKPRPPSSERDIARSIKWQKENPERFRQRCAAHYIKNRVLKKQQTAAWAANNREKVRSISHNRRARYLAADGFHTVEDDQRIRTLQKDKCAYCRVKLNGKGHLDHIKALSRGGSNWPNNLQWLCPSCNSSKNAKDPIVFAQGRGMLI